MTTSHLVLGLPVGVWVDRLPRCPLLIAADLSRAILLATVPVAAGLHLLGIEHLYVVAFASGIFTVLYDIAEDAFLPAVIAREQVVEGNSKMAAVDSLAEITGPAVAGGLVQWLTAPIALVVDGLSFVTSALFLMCMRVVEPALVPREARQHLWAAVHEGIRFVVHHPLRRPLTASSSTLQLFGGMFDALFVLFVVRELHVEPASVGLFFAIGSVRGLIGAALSRKLVGSAGIGRIVMVAVFCIGISRLAKPLARGTPLVAFTIVACSFVVGGLGNTLYNISAVSLSQTATPDRLFGRVNATQRFIGYGVLPIGSLIGGFLGEAIGLRTTLLIAGVGGLSACLWIMCSPLSKYILLHPVEEST